MSGYWKLVYYWDESTGRKQSMRIWVNTPDPVSKKTGAKRRAGQNAAAAKAQREARRRAQAQAAANAAAAAARAAARIAREKALAQSRREAYAALQRRQARLLRERRIIRDQKSLVKTTASTYISERESLRDEMAQMRQIQWANSQREQARINAEREAERQKTATEDARKRWLLIKLGGNRDTKRRASTGLPPPGPDPLTAEDIKDLELVLKAEADRASKGQFDTAGVEKLRAAYEKYATDVYDDYEDLVVRINSAIDKGQIERARSLYEKYKKVLPEFQRLFGTGKNALKDGVYNQLYQNYQRIGQAQRDWWKAQMKAQLEKTIQNGIDDRPGRTVSPDVAEAQELLDLINGKVQTRRVADGVDRFGNITYRNFTIEEELAARQAEKIMEMEKMRAAYSAQQHAIKVQMMKEGYVEYKGQYVERQQLPIVQAAESVVNSQYGGTFDPKEPHDIHQFVDKMLVDWDRSHPKPTLVRQGRYYTSQSQLAVRQWEEAKRRYEDEAYKFFGLGPQGILEKGMATPGISHALQLLQAPFSAIGAGGRTLNAAVFGESTIGGKNPTYLDAPPAIKAQMEAYAQEWMRKQGQAMFGGGGIVATRWDPRAGMEQAKNEFFQKWLQTPDGQRWLKGTLDERTRVELEANTAFVQSRMPGTDPWDAIKGLNEYGSRPFQNEGANLLASLLLDPLNAIPLKFTTYLARGKYALEATQGLSKVTRPLTATKSFLTVDEGTLGLWKHFKGLEKELAQKGMSRDRFLDTLRERVVGVKGASARNEAVRDLMRELGIDPRKVNESQLYNLTERLIQQKIKGEKLDFFSQADELASKYKAADEAAKVAEKERVALAKAEQDRVAKSLRAREAQARAARTAEGAAKRAEEAALVKKADDAAKLADEVPVTKKAAADRAQQAGAAKGVAGPPSPAKPKRAPAETARLRKSYGDAIDAVRAGKSATDPETGKTLTFLSQNHAIAYYQKQIEALDIEAAPAARTGASGTIETKMAAGDTAGSQAANIEEGLARGGTVESGGAMKPNARLPEVTSAPASPLDPALAPTGEVLAETLGKMTEPEWYAHVKGKMGAILVSKKSTPAAKKVARARLAQVKLAELAMEAEKKGGSYVSWKDRANFQKRVLRLFGKDAEGYIAPRLVAPFVQSARDIVVEQARTYYKLLSAAEPVDLPGVGSIRVNGKTIDFMPLDVFRALDQRISAAIRDARGYSADTVTRSRGSRLAPDDPDALNALGRMSDRDRLVVAAKQRALKEYAQETGNIVPMAAYDEARKVLWKGHVQSRTSRHLLRLAKEKVAKSGGDLEKAYLELRDELARRESRRQLGGMAFGRHYGVNPNVIFSEFVARYSDDGTIRHFSPELTGFQRRTLEEGFEKLAGRSAKDPEVGGFLQSANRPPLENRELTREFQKRTGAWAPRLAEDFVQGAKSWSITDEASYWLDNFGEVPEWADVARLADDGPDGFNWIFHDHAKYIMQMKAWGVFSRSNELALRLDGVTMAEIEAAVLKGDPELGLPARRALELQRRYVMERFGSLVTKDGKTLDAMPWLMHEDELRKYFAKTSAKDMPPGLIQNEKELAEVESLISKGIDRFWDRYIGAKAADGPIHYHDVFRLASEIQTQLLANPKWARRYRDVFGNTLNTWAWVNRWLVFSNPSFMVVNLVDAPLKGAWYRFTRRGLYNRALDGSPLAKKADELTPEMFGWDAQPAMYRAKQMKARDRIVTPRGLTAMDRVVDRAMAAVQFTGEAFPEVAGRAELATRMRLAKGMYPEVYSQALKRLGDPELAQAASLAFIKKEVGKAWPTAGDGPIEQLWNRFAPFASYTLRNKVFWISEAIGHPVVLVHFERIGAAIEAHNLREWEKDHPGMPMPEHLRRLIELPWAKGYYIDLAQFTDASRGLKPLYDTNWKSNLDRINDWFRMVNPNMQAGIYALFNAFNLFPRTAWEVGEDGRYHLVTVPWAEPWSKEAASLGSVLWFVDAVQTMEKYGIDGWTSGEASAMIGQVFFFNAIKTYDKMSVLYGYYKGLSAEDKRTFRDTPEGHAMMEWLAERGPQQSPFKGDLLTMMADHDKDPGRWWFLHQPDGWKARVNEARDKITAIRDAFAAELYMLTPGTAEYREMKARMYLAISDVYTQYPELMEAEVYSKSASEWAAQLADWQTDKLMDDFMALSRQRPQRAQYESSAAYNKAVTDWERQKQIFLNTYPQVKERLAGEIVEVESVRDAIEQQWNEVLGRIAKRNEAIDAAKAILERFGRDSARGRNAQERLDLLYLQNDLDYSLLERDYAATYFSPDDYERLPDGVRGELRQPGLLKRATTFMDFDRAVYEKHRKAGTLEEYLAKAAYGQAIKKAMLYAKGGDPFGKFDPAKWMKYMQDHPNVMESYFGNNPLKRDEWARSARYIEGIRALWKQAGNDPAKWVRLLKQDPWLLKQYFARNPGKQAEWARMDSYIRHISVWGKLVGAERWDEANAVWDDLPQWVKDMYYERHPEKRKRAQQTAEYLGYMKRWVSLFESGNDEKAMKYFNSLPKWARDRYYKAHPENRMRFENSERINTMLREYFAAEKQYRGEYLAQHPALKKWLAQNAGSKELERLAILQAYRTIPKGETWLRKVFRERYPEVFSPEAIGEQKLKAVYDILAKHPGILPEFEKWVETIWKTYDEMLRLGTPRPAKLYFERDRDEERKRRGLLASRSAAEVSG